MSNSTSFMSRRRVNYPTITLAFVLQVRIINRFKRVWYHVHRCINIFYPIEIVTKSPMCQEETMMRKGLFMQYKRGTSCVEVVLIGHT